MKNQEGRNTKRISDVLLANRILNTARFHNINQDLVPIRARKKRDSLVFSSHSSTVRSGAIMVRRIRTTVDPVEWTPRDHSQGRNLIVYNIIIPTVSLLRLWRSVLYCFCVGARDNESL